MHVNKETNYDQPLVSVLVPVYQVENYIERCARSLFEQTYDNLEYVFCDDCTPDGSMQVLERVMVDYPNRARQIHIIHHERNRGNAAARNTLLDNCTGDFLFWVDSDDWVEFNAVELLVKKQQETDADIVTGRAYAHLENRTMRCQDGWNLDKESLIQEIILCKCGATLWRRLIRKSLYIDNNIKCHEGVDGRVDYSCIIPLLYYAQRVVGIDAIVYHFNRTNNHSMSYGYKDLAYQKNYLESCRLISLFFEMKDKNYYHMCKEMMIKRAHDFMMTHYRHRCRKAYQSMAQYLSKSDKKYWEKIRWEKWIIRTIESNYYMMRLTYPFRKIYAKHS